MSYKNFVNSVQRFAFQWISRNANHIPSEYSEIVSQSYDSDMQSLRSYLNLRAAIRRKVGVFNRPIPPAQMIRPTFVIFWNAVKGGVDVYSRTLVSFAKQNASAHPISAVVGRLLCMQMANAAVVYRLLLAAKKNKVPVYDSTITSHSYFKLRKAVL